MGLPFRMAELLGAMQGAAYVVRRSLHNVKEINRAKKAIRKAFQTQQAGLGFSMVELLSSCPTNWGLTAPAALKWIEDRMLPYYPLGDYKMLPEVEALK
jgi:2-oxoglutarate ferredoxin oxidoreductase subunit beta